MLHQKWLVFKISASVPTLWPDLCFCIRCLMIWTDICVTSFHRSIWSVYPLVWSRLEEIPVMIWLSGWCFVGGALGPHLFCSPAIQSARQYLRPAQSCTLRDFISYLMEVTQPRCFVTLCLFCTYFDLTVFSFSTTTLLKWPAAQFSLHRYLPLGN